MTRSLPLALLLATLPAAAFAAPIGPPPRPDGGPQADRIRLNTEERQGTLKSYNLTPRGQPDSLLLATDQGTIQINFPMEFGEKLAATFKPDAKLAVTVAPDGPPNPPMPPAPPQGGPDGQGPNAAPGRRPAPSPPAHPVFRLVSIKDPAGKELTPPRPVPQHVEGTVAALNYDRRALVNGAQLDTGDLLLFGPREAQLANLKVGDKVTADGPAEKLPNGKLALRPNVLNGQNLRPNPPMPPNRPGEEGPPPPFQPQP